MQFRYHRYRISKHSYGSFTGMEQWSERRDHIMNAIDRLGSITANYPSRGKNAARYFGCDGKYIIVKQRDFDRLEKMGWIKKKPQGQRNVYVRNIEKEPVVVTELREPYKKRKLAIQEFKKVNSHEPRLHTAKKVGQEVQF